MRKTLTALLIIAGLASCNNSQGERKSKAASPTYSTLEFVNKENIFYSLELERFPDKVNAYDPTTFAHGYDRLHFYEAMTPTDKSISLGDHFVLTGPSQFTHVLGYVDHDPFNKQITVWDRGTGWREYTYDSLTNIGDLVVAGVSHITHIDPLTGNLSIDQNGDGVLNGVQSPIVDINGDVTTEEDLTQ